MLNNINGPENQLTIPKLVAIILLALMGIANIIQIISNLGEYTKGFVLNCPGRYFVNQSIPLTIVNIGLVIATLVLLLGMIRLRRWPYFITVFILLIVVWVTFFFILVGHNPQILDSC